MLGKCTLQCSRFASTMTPLKDLFKRWSVVKCFHTPLFIHPYNVHMKKKPVESCSALLAELNWGKKLPVNKEVARKNNENRLWILINEPITTHTKHGTWLSIDASAPVKRQKNCGRPKYQICVDQKGEPGRSKFDPWNHTFTAESCNNI